MLTILTKAIGSGIVGAVETLAQVFAGLGKYAKIGVDLASGNLGAAISAFLGKPNAGSAKGEFATVLTDIPKTLVTVDGKIVGRDAVRADSVAGTVTRARR
ncbi:MAG TPA: hypothetical protein VH594_26370 [Trebonia sp.]|jgi:hypothetical protein